jgi:hypothetical protein
MKGDYAEQWLLTLFVLKNYPLTAIDPMNALDFNINYIKNSTLTKSQLVQKCLINMGIKNSIISRYQYAEIENIMTKEQKKNIVFIMESMPINFFKLVKHTGKYSDDYYDKYLSNL